MATADYELQITLSVRKLGDQEGCAFPSQVHVLPIDDLGQHLSKGLVRTLKVETTMHLSDKDAVITHCEAWRKDRFAA